MSESRKGISKKLYKYRNINEWSIKSIEDNEFWLSKPKEFNDPYDCAINMNIKEAFNKTIDAKEVEKLKKWFYGSREKIYSNCNREDRRNMKREIKKDFKREYGKSYDEIVDYLCSPNFNIDVCLEMFMKKEKVQDSIDEIIEGLKDNTYVGCLSGTNESILMWSHYANSHTGFCIEYDFKEIEKIHQKLFKVKYTNKIDNLNKISEALPNNIRAIISALTTKAEEWSYEDEWRIIEQPKIEADNLNKGKNVEMPTPSSIYMGCKISEDDRKKLKYICRNKSIKLYQMHIKTDEFKLEFKEVKIK